MDKGEEGGTFQGMEHILDLETKTHQYYTYPLSFTSIGVGSRGVRGAVAPLDFWFN